tara:strand:+ start:18255 stop:19499 length:1245 start_codon:yes stop_codon:yes gene_type:complete
MSKIRLVVFAYHHNSSNVASLRYRSLIKYLDKDVFEVFVITACNDDEKGQQKKYIHPVNGTPIGSSSKKHSILAVIALAITSNLPNFLKSNNGSSWAFNAVDAASKLVTESKIKGQPCLVLGTYSPVDALIAAKFVANKFSIPLIQDFRDGFAFEPLGRKGFFAHWARLLIENSVCSNADVILSATPSINKYFLQKYGESKVGLLMNGFDPDDQDLVDANSLCQARELLSDALESRKFLVGHFGRISMSDASRRRSLDDLVRAVNKAPNSTQRSILFLFMGQLDPDEEESLKRLDAPYKVFPAQDRKTALAAMTMCDSLLLITGSGSGCVSGKIFEYMSFKKNILHFSQVRNDASKILDDYGNSLQHFPDNLEVDFNLEKILDSNTVCGASISDFSRKSQARDLQGVLSRLVIR